MAGKYVAVFETELQMPEMAGPVHNKGKARSSIRLLSTAHQNLLSHLYSAFKLDFPNTRTQQWVWIEVILEGFHLPWLLCKLSAPNERCVRCVARLQWARISSGQCHLSFLQSLRGGLSQAV